MNKNTIVVCLLVILVIVLTVLILKRNSESFRNKYMKLNPAQLGVLKHSQTRKKYPHVSLMGWVSSNTMKDKKLRHLINEQYKKTRCCETPHIGNMPKYEFLLPKQNELMGKPLNASQNNRNETMVKRNMMR
jgi:hypothetical protein